MESKNWKVPVGVGEVEHFLKACRVAQADRPGNEPPARWFFGRSGFTAKAEALLRQEQVLFSDGEQLDALLATFGLRPLPALKE